MIDDSTAAVVSDRSEAGHGVRLALALGGGAARGLAHIGVLEVLEREGIRPDFIAGSSMGGLIGALSASGMPAREIEDVARGFRFPRWFIPGGLLRWASLFGPATSILSGTFERLAIPLALTAVDLEEGTQVVLHTGPVLAAVQAPRSSASMASTTVAKPASRIEAFGTAAQVLASSRISGRRGAPPRHEPAGSRARACGAGSCPTRPANALREVARCDSSRSRATRGARPFARVQRLGSGGPEKFL